jgi:hypothetical protein
MEELSLSPRRYAVRETAAWRAPSATRFDSRPANDAEGAEQLAPPLSRWLVVVGGGGAAALIGAALGGMLAL